MPIDHLEVHTKTEQRAKRRQSARIKKESGSMTAVYRHEEMNKGRLKSKLDRKLTKITIRNRKSGKA